MTVTASTTDRPQTSVQRWFSRRSNIQTVALLGVLGIVYLCFSLTAPSFASVGNQLNILQNAAFVGIVAMAMTLVIIAGEIDISVGSAVALGSALLGVTVGQWGLPVPLAILVVLAEGALMGAFAGWVRSRFGVPSFIVTLALYGALRGLALLITNAYPIPLKDPFLVFLGSGRLLGIPVVAIAFMLVFAVIAFVATKTPFGRSVYAVGGNPEAARLSGINVARVRVLVFILTGLAAAMVGVLQSARLSSGTASIGTGVEFDAIAAVIIGGTLLSGGRGSVLGTFIGVIFITVLGNGMVLLGVNPYAQEVVRGVVVLLAVLISVWQRKGKR
ncbi:ABC transporter permease [Microbacterium sp.]|uniref:ABC transporter permease n=1 Tax=Microbacterium sp. TaxID=51671 RepID=UPI003A929AB5